jgi:hypothetical protein
MIIIIIIIIIKHFERFIYGNFDQKNSKSKLYDFDCQAQNHPGMSNDFIIKQKT